MRVLDDITRGVQTWAYRMLKQTIRLMLLASPAVGLTFSPLASSQKRTSNPCTTSQKRHSPQMSRLRSAPPTSATSVKSACRLKGLQSVQTS